MGHGRHVAALLIALGGCVAEAPDTSGRCAGCHGDDASLAPPRALGGVTDEAFAGVGAHRVHLDGSVLGTPVACEECHLVPTAYDAEGHVDSAWPAEVVWGPLAKADEPTAGATAWDREAETCVVYCHGSTLQGGAHTEPVWTQVDGTQVGCGSCHGDPPPPPHEASSVCGSCHPPATSATHMDGTLQTDFAVGGCAGCHGTPDNLAPPADTEGRTDPALPSVGAHAAHAGFCGACHVVPSATEDAGHLDPAPAEVVFAGLAVADGATPAWEADQTCSGSYCHGATLSGASDPDPSWVGGSATSCATCHGNPPPPPHTSNAACADCHARPPERHVDGVLDTELASCEGCHGTGSDLMPPTDSQGETDPSLRSVGAHAAHAGVACSDCHVVPAGWSDPGHIDPAPAEVAFGGLAAAMGATPTWEADLTCAGTYCHSAMEGGSDPDPSWVAGSTTNCGTCHGNPPPLPHTPNPACGTCHGPFDADTHVDGVLTTALADCSGCHGSGLGAALAPPPDVLGQTDTTLTSVGAHDAHTAPTIGAVVACSDCHTVPAGWSDPGHIDPAPAEVVLGGVAAADGASPMWDGATCTVYCHGATMSGGTSPAPVWTTVDGTQMMCGSCHALPPPPPHPGSAACSGCHGSVVNAAGGIIAPEQHVDGTVDF